MSSTNPEKIGLPYWMDRALQEHSKVGDELAADPVHDLRVALRRCVLIADLMRNLDPGSDWKSMRKAGRRIFQSLGALRDTQVLTEWIEKLGPPGEASTASLLESVKAKSEQDRTDAQQAVKKFDRKQWRAWTRELSAHYRHVISDRPACEALLLEIWSTVHDLHRRARRSNSRVAYHRLRVGLKKFRYAVENFLPSMYPVWSPDLKFLQDLLGEMHDLDVLHETIGKNRRLLDEETHALWVKKLGEERATRLQQYRTKMVGKASPLWTWRDALPSADQELRSAGLSQLAEWAYFVTPDFTRARRVSRLALQLFDGLENCGLTALDWDAEGRSILHAAALLQEVGHFKKGKGHHKESYRMIRKVTPPPGWTKNDLELVALVARFHRRALPRPDHKILKAYEFPVRQSVILLAAILRFANAFDAKPYRAIRRLEVENSGGAIVVRPEGFSEKEAVGSKLSAARRLMEFVCQRPVHILAPGAQIMSPQIMHPATRIDAA